MTGESKQIIVGLNSYPLKDEKARTDIAPEFSKSVSYAVGDYVLYEGYLYKFTSAHSAGNWSASDVTQVAVGDELSSLDETEKNIESSLAIVADGDTHIAITSGQYVYVKNHSTLAEGLYTANSAIGADVVLTVSNLTSVSGGGLNKLNIKSVIVTATTDANGNFTTTLPVTKKVVMVRAIREEPYATGYYLCIIGTSYQGYIAVTCVSVASDGLHILANSDIKIEISYYD